MSANGFVTPATAAATTHRPPSVHNVHKMCKKRNKTYLIPFIGRLCLRPALFRSVTHFKIDRSTSTLPLALSLSVTLQQNCQFNSFELKSANVRVNRN